MVRFFIRWHWKEEKLAIIKSFLESLKWSPWAMWVKEFVSYVIDRDRAQDDFHRFVGRSDSFDDFSLIITFLCELLDLIWYRLAFLPTNQN